MYQGPGQKKLDGRAKPVIEMPTDAVARITKTTICDTDLHTLNEDMRQRIEELAHIAAAMHMQTHAQARPDNDGVQNAN